MSFVQLSKICLSFGARDILQDVTLTLTAGTKAALTGANGSGKSTLMKIIAGINHADSGEISCEKGCKTAYLPQSGIAYENNTLYTETETAFSAGADLLVQLDKLGSKMKSEADENELKKMSIAYHELQSKLENSGWYSREGLIHSVLFGLGFKKSDLIRKVDEFSGGWQMRIALAKILLSGADIIILDEPTNYLDIEARNWLEDYLRSFKGGFLLVSHDRYFLDATINETYELFNGKVTRYTGTYTKYEEIRKVELDSLLKAHEKQQDEIAKTEDFIRKFRYNKSKAAMVQDRIRRLEKIERIEIPEHLKKIHFSFPDAPHSGKIVLQAENIEKSFGEHTVLKDLNLLIERNEKVVLVGRNGAGKTTLLKILAKQDFEFSGEVKEGAGVAMGYFSQDASESITGEERIIDVLENEAPTELVPKLRDMLGAFLFRGDDVYKPLSVLSGGEKSRLALLRLLLKPYNLLILDEPTNHLDLHSKDALLEALLKFNGTVIFVSHDKTFIQGLADRVIELKPPEDDSPNMPSKMRNFPGTYDYYLYRLQQEAGEVTEDFSKAKTEAPKKAGALNYEEQKKRRSQFRKLQKEEERLMLEIEQNDEDLKNAENNLAKPEIYSDPEKSKEAANLIKALKQKAEELTLKWEEAARQVEEFDQEN